MTNSKSKGKRFELEIANRLKELWKYARRSIMSGAAFETGDISKTPFDIECKFYQKMSIYKHWEQLMDERVTCGSKRIPVLFIRANQKKPLAVMDLDDWLCIMQFLKEQNYFEE